jgi:hypothetical protein
LIFFDKPLIVTLFITKALALLSQNSLPPKAVTSFMDDPKDGNKPWLKDRAGPKRRLKELKTRAQYYKTFR